MEVVARNELVVGETYYFKKNGIQLKGIFNCVVEYSQTSVLLMPVYDMKQKEYRNEHNYLFPDGISRCFVFPYMKIYRKTKVYNKIMYKVLSIILDELVAKSLCNYF